MSFRLPLWDLALLGYRGFCPLCVMRLMTLRIILEHVRCERVSKVRALLRLAPTVGMACAQIKGRGDCSGRDDS